jgi:hypothetical protein
MTSPTNGQLPMTGPLLDQFGASVYEGPEGGQPSVATVQQTSNHYVIELLRRHAVAAERNARIAFDKTHPVDEYISSLGVPEAAAAGGGAYPPFTSYVRVTPTWETTERIESIVYTIPAGATSCVAILGDRYINLFPPSFEGDQGNSLEASGDATAPAAFTSIAAIANVPAGTYEATVQFNMEGTPAQGTDNDNIQLTVLGNIQGGTLANGIESGEQTFGPFIVTTTTAGTWQVRSGGNAGTAGAVYAATLTLIPQAPLGIPYTNSFNGLGIILTRDDDRVMAMTGPLTTGPTHFELMGYADEIYGNA